MLAFLSPQQGTLNLPPEAALRESNETRGFVWVLYDTTDLKDETYMSMNTRRNTGPFYNYTQTNMVSFSVLEKSTHSLLEDLTECTTSLGRIHCVAVSSNHDSPNVPTLVTTWWKSTVNFHLSLHEWENSPIAYLN